VELDGKPAQDVRVSFAGPIVAAREVNAQEQPLSSTDVKDSQLRISFTPFQPRTFALRLGAPTTKLTAPTSHPVKLKFDLAVTSNDDTQSAGGGFDGTGNAMPAEMLPSRIRFRDVEFELALAKTSTPNALVARGQTIALPEGRFNRVYILAASAEGDQNATFAVGNANVDLTIQDWTGFVGQWDTRLWKNQTERDWATSANHAVWPPADLEEREKRPASPRYPEDYAGLKPGYVKSASLAWYASHQHTAKGLNQPYRYSYLFAYALDAPGNAKTLKLPDNDKIRILAISTVDENPTLEATQSLYTTLNGAEPPSAAEGMTREQSQR
jgi:alpha-mannosidase